MIPDPNAVSSLLAEVARTEVLPRFRRLSDDEVWEKAPGATVTPADEAAEKALAEGLARLLPEAVIVGEEGVEAEPERLNLLKGDTPVWVIDPVDGTTNFARGTAIFGMVVALVAKGCTVGAWIHDPLNDATMVAVRGQGALYRGHRLRLEARGAKALLAGAVSYGLGDAVARSALRERAADLGGMYSLRCASMEYVRLLTREVDYTLYNRLMPWDHLAGTLLVAEAGGVSAHLDGSPYRVDDTRGTLLHAPDPPTWARIRNALFPERSGQPIAGDVT